MQEKNISITIGGDFNFIENKLLSQASLNCFKEFIRGINVVLAKNSFQYTYHSKANNSYSKLDHFKMSDMLQGDCSVAAIVESSETFSGHSPFQNSIKVQMASVTKKDVLNLPDIDRPDWSNHSKELFYRNTADVLYAMPVLDDCCTNAFCASTKHRKKINTYFDKLTSILQNCRVMKTIRKNGFQAKYFWNNNLSELKRTH